MSGEVFTAKIRFSPIAANDEICIYGLFYFNGRIHPFVFAFPGAEGRGKSDDAIYKESVELLFGLKKLI